jgi:glycosyltransferase involved in cell wall biosynthesis
MNKPVLLLMAPVATVSGYGARSRDIAHSLIKSGKYDVKIWNTRWGGTPMNALDPTNPKHKAIIDRLMTEPQLSSQPEVFIQVTVPNEFQRLGKYNIGITAGMETTIASAPWIEGCNKMDLILTSSEHSKNVLAESVWMKQDKDTKQPVGELRLEKPIEVLFEGVDLDVYFPTKDINATVVDELKSIKEEFAFLHIGHWLSGDFGEDRKNVSGLIRTFLETYKNKSAHNQPALILKTSSSDFSPLDKEEVLRKIEAITKSVTSNRLPNVYLLHGDLTDEEMNSLYNHPKVKAHISLTKGEGYGRPLAEAGMSQKPIIATNWSGHIDFLTHAVLLPGTLTNVHPSAAWKDVILEESQWMTVDYAYASATMRSMTEDYKQFTDLGKAQCTNIKKNFSLDAMHDKLVEILDRNVPKFPQQVQLKLPSLKKIELPRLKQVE